MTNTNQYAVTYSLFRGTACIHATSSLAGAFEHAKRASARRRAGVMIVASISRDGRPEGRPFLVEEVNRGRARIFNTVALIAEYQALHQSGRSEMSRANAAVRS